MSEKPIEIESNLKQVDGSLRVDALILLADECRLRDDERYYRLTNEAYQLSEELGYDKGLAKTLLPLSQANWKRGQQDLAISLSHKALTTIQEIGDQKLEAEALNVLALQYKSLGDYAKGMDYYHQAIRIYEKQGNKVGLAKSLNNLGEFYVNMNDVASALENHHRALLIFKEESDQLGEASSLYNIASIYETLGNNDEALTFYSQSIDLFHQSGDKNGETRALNGIGSVYAKLSDFQSAFDFHVQCIEISERLGFKRIEAEALIKVANLYLNKKFEGFNFNEGISCLTKARDLAIEINAKDLIYSAYYELSKGYDSVGDSAKALDFFKLYNIVKEEQFSEEQARKVASLQVVYQLEQAKRETELLREKSNQLVTLNNALSSTLFEMEKQKSAVQEQKKLAEEANAFKTELLGIAAHDLKNPLQSILGFSELLQMAPAERQQVIELTGVIRESAKRMLKLISDLLQTTMAEGGKLKLRKVRADLSDLARWSVADCEFHAMQKDQKIVCEVETNCIVDMDMERMKEVLENLISNAIKYSPKGKTIYINVSKVKIEKAQKGALFISQDAFNGVRFSIRDEGQGLTEDDMKKLYGRFQRLSAQPTGGEGSTGLGLAIVKQLVELHDGTVRAESEGFGKGTTFHVELPGIEYIDQTSDSE